MVAGSSILASPAFAVDKEIVGNDNEGALRLICDRSAACAVCCSLVFGEEEKNWVNRFPLDVDGLRAVGCSPAGMVVVVEVGLTNGLRMGFL